MKVLVTGADGFVGRYLVRQLLASGHAVIAAVRRGGAAPDSWLDAGEQKDVEPLEFDLEDPAAADAAARRRPDGVIHLAAVASSREARRDPGLAWTVNAAGTARLLEALGAERARGACDPVVVVVSSGEVYGAGAERPRHETDAVRPQSPYAATKAAAEIGALEIARRTGLRVIIARAFQHTGPGQAELYVVPALARRLAEARRAGRRDIPVGNLEPVRDITDVRDVVAAYVALLERGAAGEIYNVARGEGIALADVFVKLARILETDAVPIPDASLVRSGDIPHLVGDPAKIRAATGWIPAHTIDQTLRDVVDAQAD
ncbi:MAG TPA: GDP-mannose 4,6-dehydratase [Gemmatimonadales bacterium]|nr:GDP-mannose 4,6-dehydratase [Gemmatimonadales bacterium]